MHIDRQRLKGSVDEFIATDEGDALFGRSLIANLIVFFGALLIGVFLIATVIGIIWGAKCLFYALTFGPFREPVLEKDNARPLIAHGVIINAQVSSGERSKGPGMVLATFEDEFAVSPDYLHELAERIGDIYGAGADEEDEDVLEALVADDRYRGERGQLVPEPWAQGRQIFVYSAFLGIDNAGVSPDGSALFAFVGDPRQAEEAGFDEFPMAQIPWEVVEDAVSFEPAE